MLLEVVRRVTSAAEAALVLQCYYWLSLLVSISSLIAIKKSISVLQIDSKKIAAQIYMTLSQQTEYFQQLDYQFSRGAASSGTSESETEGVLVLLSIFTNSPINILLTSYNLQNINNLFRHSCEHGNVQLKKVIVNVHLTFGQKLKSSVSEMKFICLTLLLVRGITDSRSEQYEVVGPADPVFAVAGEDVILPCSVKPNISVVDMRVEWFRPDQKDSQLVHLYEDHKDRNTDQIQSYRGRTKLYPQELQRGNASLKLPSVQISDEGRYKCFIQSKSWSDDATVNVRVEVVGRPPVITVDGFDRSGGLHLQCESEGWYPEPDLEWLDSEGVSLSSGTTETHRNTDKFGVKNIIIVYHSGKIHCRVKLRHHMLETLIDTSNNRFISWRTSVILSSVFLALSVTAGLLIAAFAHKYREQTQLRNEKNRIQDERDQLLQSLKMVKKQALTHLRTYRVNVILDADSAHPRLIVSDDGKQVKDGNRKGVDEEKDKFDEYLGVLGKDGFSSGSFYFEVQVKDQTKWDVGVARESVNRKGWMISLSPNDGYWTVGLRDGKYWTRDSSYVSLSMTVKPQRIGVFVDYEKGLISFYDVKSMSHIYSFTGQSFTEKLYPFVGLGYWKNNNSTPLIICD